MRLWQLIVAVILVATVLAIWRDVVGRVALIVFFTGLGEIVLGTASIMALFQSLGAMGRAEQFRTYAEALASTALIVIVASVSMAGLLWVGSTMVQAAVR